MVLKLLLHKAEAMNGTNWSWFTEILYTVTSHSSQSVSQPRLHCDIHKALAAELMMSCLNIYNITQRYLSNRWTVAQRTSHFLLVSGASRRLIITGLSGRKWSPLSVWLWHRHRVLLWLRMLQRHVATRWRNVLSSTLGCNRWRACRTIVTWSPC